MRIRLALFTLVTVAGLTCLAVAHEGHDHVRGTVAVVDASHVEVKTGYGKTVSVALTPDTKFFKGSAVATSADVKVGLRVVIDANKAGEGLAATVVKIGAAAPAASPATPKP